MKSKIEIAIVDDEVLFCEGIQRVLKDENDFEVCIIAHNGEEFIEQLKTAEKLPDVALIDVRMEPMDGFETVKFLSKEYPSIKSVILSSYYEEAFIGHMVQLGVAAFLPKNAKKETLTQAIIQVHTKGVYFSSDDHAMLLRYIQKKSANVYFKMSDQLTSREQEVLILVCQEYTNQEIADKLFLSRRTIESHRLRIIEKLGVKNSAGMIIYAITQRLYKPEARYYF